MRKKIVKRFLQKEPVVPDIKGNREQRRAALKLKTFDLKRLEKFR